jgi:hypothetical protein
MFNVFSHPSKWLVGLLLALVLWLTRSQPIPAQTPQTPGTSPTSSVAGRYHLATNNNFVYFTDTQTGRVWWQFTGNPNSDSLVWQEMISPVVPTP